MSPRRKQRDADLDEEIRSHLRMAIADRVARGEPIDEAAAAARREFGNVGHVKEVTRESWGGMWWDRLRQDVRYAARSLRRAPGFTAAAVITFALGIGVNTAMFTIVNAVLLRPLPFHDSDRLYLVSHIPPGLMFDQPDMLDREYEPFRRSTRAFSATTSYNLFPATVTGAGEPTRVPTISVTEGFFSLLGVSPAAGRAFTSDEYAGAGAPVVVLSDALWRERFGADRSAIGKSIAVDGEQRTIVGVMPSGFDFPGGARLWFPTHYTIDAGRAALRPVLGRLAPGATEADARRELAAFVASLRQGKPGPDRSRSDIVSLKRFIVGDVQRSLWLFTGAVALVLLIACANVANLLLMRASTRQHEISIRAAIGAGRMRLVRQLLTESLVLAIAGGIIGVGLAMAGIKLLLAMAPAGLLPRTSEIGLDWMVLSLTALTCVVAGTAFGIVPAFYATRRDLRAAFATARTTAGTAHGRWRSALVAAECALAVVLLVGAGLLLRSFWHLRSVDWGFQPGNKVTFLVNLPPDRYATAASLHEFRARTLEKLAAMPGVADAAVVNWRPLSPSFTMGDFVLEDGRPLPQGFIPLKPAASPDYFRVMGIGVREGRAFTNHDDASASGVVIVSRLVAEQLWPNESAVGKRISMADKPGPGDWLTIVGVVDDIVQSDRRGARMPAVYLPIAQVKQKFWLNQLNFVARVAGDPSPVERAIRSTLRDLDPLLPVESITTMDAVVASNIAEPLFQTRLLIAFAVLAIGLAAVGIYGVLAYAVAERRHEIGVRLALGATGGRVSWLIMSRTLGIAVPGVALGLAAAWLASRVMGTLLFEVSPHDTATFAIVPLVLIATALVATALPARRAARVDPLSALRA